MELKQKKTCRFSAANLKYNYVVCTTAKKYDKLQIGNAALIWTHGNWQNFKILFQ